jgi:hypothetical protein
MSKTIILLLITLTTFTNFSYASFPIDTNRTDTSKVIVKETTEQYHLRMEKQGFDISNCMCIDCRKFKGSSFNTESNLSPNQKAHVNIAFLAAAMIIGFITLAIYVDFSNFPPIIIPIILTIGIFIYVNILINKMQEEKNVEK